MQSVILLDTTSGLVNVTGNPQRGAGYSNSIGNNHTVSFSINNFVGRIYIEGTLAEKPKEEDWVPIPLFNSLPYVQYPLNPAALIGNSPGTPNVAGDTGNFVYNFTGNFIWVRARIDRTYLVPPPTTWTQVGAVLKILLNYGSVTPAGANNATYSNIGGLQGPPGPQGPTGAASTVQGPAGPQGPQGLQGIQGIQGQQGLQGDTGPTGPQGDIGPQGVQGDTGPEGLQGNTGPTGADSTVTGPTGDTGPQGLKGDTGASGADSTVTGPTGDTGPQGQIGMMGSIGPTGVTGPTGAQGIQGEQGPQGFLGGIGPTGPTGSSLTVAGITGAVQYSLGDSLGGSSTELYWNPELKRLGINTDDLSEATMSVVGAAPVIIKTTLVSDYALCVGSSVATAAIVGLNEIEQYAYLQYTQSQQKVLSWNGYGIGINNVVPVNALDVAGGAVIGGGVTWAGYAPAPQNGLIVEGSVGIGVATPSSKLEVAGDIKISTTDAGIYFPDGSFLSTANSVAGPTGPTGASGIDGATGPIGNTGPTGPALLVAPPVAVYQTYVFTATAGQTDFAVNYSSSIDVYVNGTRLIPSDYTATDNVTVVLAAPLTGGETVNIVVWQSSTVSDINTPVTVYNPYVFSNKISMTNLTVANNDIDAQLAGVGINEVYRDSTGVLRIRIV